MSEELVSPLRANELGPGASATPGVSRGPSLLRGLASSWMGLVAGVGIAFFLSPFVVNKLGAEWYGVWAIAAQFTGYLYLLDFGVRESVIRYTSKYVARKSRRALSRMLTTALIIYGFVTILTLMVTALCVWGVPHWFSLEPRFWTNTRIAMSFAGLTIAQTFIVNIFFGIVTGLRRWDLANAIGVVANLVRAGLIVFFLTRGHGIVAVAAIQFLVGLAGGAVTTLVALQLLRNHQLGFVPQWMRLRRLVALARHLLSYGFYIIVSNIGEKVIGATDAVIVGIYLPIASVTYYAIAGSLVGYLKSVLATTAQVFNPLASHLHTGRQRAELQRALLLGVTLNVATTLPAVVTLVVLGDVFIGLWMGADFAAPSGQVLAVLAFTAVFTGPHYIVSSVLFGMSRHRSIALLRIGEAIANLVLSIVLVQTIGLVGVAVGTVVPNAVIGLIFLPVIVRRLVGVSIWDYFTHAYIRPVLAVTPMAAGAYMVRLTAPPRSLLSFLLCVAALLLLYLPCAYAVCLERKERELIMQRLLPRLGLV